MTEQERKNRLRCLKCSYYGMNRCPLMVDGDVFRLDICILDVLKKKNFKEDGPEIYMFNNSPTLFLSYLSFLRKDKLPEIGAKVITLRPGFSGPAGVIRTVNDISDRYIELKNESGSISISEKNVWYKDFFVLDTNN